ncbi:hypothetical protein PF003_g18816 [Phytophthora fragariae]|nr:hypothetical protein PF003_g18816 [Phytophthora fragariae]
MAVVAQAGSLSQSLTKSWSRAVAAQSLALASASKAS